MNLLYETKGGARPIEDEVPVYKNLEFIESLGLLDFHQTGLDSGKLIDMMDENAASLELHAGAKYNSLIKLNHRHIADWHRVSNDASSILELVSEKIQSGQITGKTAIATAKTLSGIKLNALQQIAVLEHGEQLQKSYRKSNGLNFMNKNTHNGTKANLGHYVQAAAGFQTKATIAEGTISAGGAVVPIQQIPETIDLLRNTAQVLNAGARVQLLESKQATIPKLLTDPVAAWRNESGAVAASDATFGQITLTPKSLSVELKVSREWMNDQVLGADLLQNAIIKALGIQLDAAALFGSGVSPIPLGLRAQLISASRSISQGANGAKLSATGYFKNLVKAAQLIASANDTATGAIMSARTLYDIAGFTDTTGQSLQPPKIISDNVTFYGSNSVPDNQTQGTATNASDIIVGNWSKVIWGLREDVTIQVLPEKYASTGEIGVVAHLRADVAVENINSFYLIQGVLPE